MGVAVTIVLLKVGAADGAIGLTKILHVVGAVAVSVIGFQGGVGAPFFVGPLEGMVIVKIGVAENKVVAAIGGAGAGGIEVARLIEIAGSLRAGGRVVAKADVAGKAEGIVLVHIEIHS